MCQLQKCSGVVLSRHLTTMSPPLGSLLLGAVALATAATANPFALPPDYHRLAPRAEGFNWQPCGEDGEGRECSRLEVPLDWNNAAAGKASLAVARYPAVKQPKLGTLFTNPGGPGWCQILDALTSS